MLRLCTESGALVISLKSILIQSRLSLNASFRYIIRLFEYYFQVFEQMKSSKDIESACGDQPLDKQRFQLVFRMFAVISIAYLQLKSVVIVTQILETIDDSDLVLFRTWMISFFILVLLLGWVAKSLMLDIVFQLDDLTKQENASLNYESKNALLDKLICMFVPLTAAASGIVVFIDVLLILRIF